MMQGFRLQGNPVQRRPNKCNYFSQQEFIHLQLKIQPLVASYFVAAKITGTSLVLCFMILVSYSSIGSPVVAISYLFDSAYFDYSGFMTL